MFYQDRFVHHGISRRRLVKPAFGDLVASVSAARIISTDVFDTLLLRTHRSERSRLLQAERAFAQKLSGHGLLFDADILLQARLEAQRMAFRGLPLRHVNQEPRLTEVVGAQLALLGIPTSFLADRVEIELEVERVSVFANRSLARVLRAQRKDGKRIIAVSDTILPTSHIAQLIEHHHGVELIDAIYASGDLGCSKRDGALFDAVAAAENISVRQLFHIGDDPRADVRMPSAKGAAVYHLRRPAYHHYMRLANGATAEAVRLARHRARMASTSPSNHENAVAFGRQVLGPIVTQFCLRIWLYCTMAALPDDAVLLFCARGGISIRDALERVLLRLGLTLPVRRGNLMISRLIAARAGLLARSNSATEELGREFRGQTAADVAAALGGRPYTLDEKWNLPFRAQDFAGLLFGPSGAEVLADIEQQNRLFTRHFKRLGGASDRVILCDTGLYGSTQRLLAPAFPELAIETIQFARSNYKGHGEEHFPRVVGLMVERNGYSPFDINSCVLRYWHLIEGLFEPAVPSVRSFTEDQWGEIHGNCGEIDYGIIDPSVKNPLLQGTFAYIDALPPGAGAMALKEAEIAWQRLKRAIIRPTRADLQCLEIADRSVDFGRADFLRVIGTTPDDGIVKKLNSLKQQVWREGAITREFPVFKRALLPMLEVAQSARGLLARQH